MTRRSVRAWLVGLVLMWVGLSAAPAAAVVSSSQEQITSYDVVLTIHDNGT